MSDKGDAALNEEFPTLTLSEFLLARIAEDESGAQAAARAAGNHWSPDPVPGRADAPAIDRHYAKWDPARVLAECEAKLRIVKILGGTWTQAKTGAPQHSLGRDSYEPDGDYVRVGNTVLRGDDQRAFIDEWYEPSPPNEAIKALAAVYADHPDYRDEWRT